MPGTDGILPHGELRSASSQSWGRSSSESSCKPFLKTWRKRRMHLQRGNHTPPT